MSARLSATYGFKEPFRRASQAKNRMRSKIRDKGKSRDLLKLETANWIASDPFLRNPDLCLIVIDVTGHWENVLHIKSENKIITIHLVYEK